MNKNKGLLNISTPNCHEQNKNFQPLLQNIYKIKILMFIFNKYFLNCKFERNFHQVVFSVSLSTFGKTQRKELRHSKNETPLHVLIKYFQSSQLTC